MSEHFCFKGDSELSLRTPVGRRKKSSLAVKQGRFETEAKVLEDPLTVHSPLKAGTSLAREGSSGRDGQVEGREDPSHKSVMTKALSDFDYRIEGPLPGDLCSVTREKGKSFAPLVDGAAQIDPEVEAALELLMESELKWQAPS